MQTFKDFILSESKKEDMLFDSYPEVKDAVNKKSSPLKVEAGKTYLFAALRVKRGEIMGSDINLTKVKGFMVINGPAMMPYNNSDELSNKVFSSWKEVQSYFGTKDKKEIVAKIKTEMGDRQAALGIVPEPSSIKTLSNGNWSPAMGGDKKRALAVIGYPKATWSPSGILVFEA